MFISRTITNRIIPAEKDVRANDVAKVYATENKWMYPRNLSNDFAQQQAQVSLSRPHQKRSLGRVLPEIFNVVISL